MYSYLYIYIYIYIYNTLRTVGAWRGGEKEGTRAGLLDQHDARESRAVEAHSDEVRDPPIEYPLFLI